MAGANDDLKALVRTIPDFPKAGIQFRDVTTLLLDGRGFGMAVERLAGTVGAKPDLVAAIEARGFILGSALARELGCGLLLIRKDGKLPGATIAEDYALEYGNDRLAMHVDACAPGARVLLADDLIATGGTALAATRLVRRAGGEVTGARFLIDLPELGGAEALRGGRRRVVSLMDFEGDLDPSAAAPPHQHDRGEAHHRHIVLVGDRHFGADAADLRLGARRSLVDDLAVHGKAVAGINRLQPAQLVDARRAQAGLVVLEMARAITAMVMAQVCQPLAARRPKWVLAAASSDRWNGCGSYFRANSRTSSRVTS